MKTRLNLKRLSVIVMGVLLSGTFLSFQQEVKKWDAPESAKKLKSTVTASAESLAEGKTLYIKHCKSCHGAGGKGDGPKAANLDVSCKDFTKPDFKKQTAGELYWKTTEGRDPMPSFKAKVSNDERWEIIGYVLTLK